MYSVAAVSRMSGVNPETLRAWERRHRVVEPRRDARGHRVYAPEDVERLRLLRRGTEQGHAISRLAGLPLAELARLVEQGPVQDGWSSRTDLHRLVDRLLDAAARYRADECDEILGLAATLLDPDTLVREVISPSMAAAGRRWHRGEFTTAQERLLTGSARRTLTTLIATYRRRADGPVMVLAGLPGEQHEVGLLVTALTASTRGVDCVCLGPDIPISDVADAVAATRARCVGLSCVTRIGACDLLASLEELCRRLPPACEVWIGGCAGADLDVASLPPRCECLAGHEDLCRRIDFLAAV